MVSVGLVAPPPPVSLLKRLQAPRILIGLALLMWIPLTVYVMFGHYFDEPLKTSILVPAIPATLILYVTAMISWRESPVAIIGTTLVFLWLIVAVTAPFLPLVDPNKPLAPFAAIGAEKAGHYFILGADFKGRDIGGGICRGRVADHLGCRLHLPQSAHPVQLRSNRWRVSKSLPPLHRRSRSRRGRVCHCCGSCNGRASVSVCFC